MVNDILNEIKADLGANFKTGEEGVLKAILDDVIYDALRVSNRDGKEVGIQLRVLKSNIKKATKTIYLQRGVEDVKSNSMAGLNNTYDNAIETMTNDIIRQNKRLLK